MKTPLLLTFLFCAGLRAAELPAGAPKELPQLVAGKMTFEKVAITKAEPDGLRITHATGVAKVRFKDMDPALAAKFGYDEEAAALHNAEEALKQASARLDADAALREERQRIVRLQNKADDETAEKAFQKKLDAAAVRVKIEAFQNSTIGLIGTVEVGKVARWDEKPGTMANTVPIWAYGPKRDAVLSGFVTAESVTAHSRYGFVRKYFAWDGKAWEIGDITYTTVLGAERTVAHFTGDRAKAAAWFKSSPR